jgi:hypothetical protein
MLPNPFYHDRHFNHPIMNNYVGDPNTAEPLSDVFFTGTAIGHKSRKWDHLHV